MAMKPMGQKIDFNKLRKARQRAQTAKRLGMLLGLFLLLGGLVLLNNFLVEESVTTRISDLVQGLGGKGFPVPLPGGIIRDVKHAGDNLVLLNDTNLYIYSPKGKTVNNVQKMSDQTVLLTGEDRLLTYDTGGKRYSIHSKSKTLLEQEMEFGIITADMNSRGDYAIVSSSKQHTCEVNVYNNKFKNIYIGRISSGLISCISLAPKGETMAAGTINVTTDGVLQSKVTLYRFSSEKEAAQLELPDAMVLNVFYWDDNRIGILTDREYLVMDEMGTVLYTYSLEGQQLSSFRIQGNLAVLLFENRETRSRNVVLLDDKCHEKGSLTTGERVLGLELSSKRVYLLTEHGIHIYNHKMELVETQAAPFGNRIHLTRNKLYYLTRDEIAVAGQVVRRERENGDNEEEREEPVSADLDIARQESVSQQEETSRSWLRSFSSQEAAESSAGGAE